MSYLIITSTKDQQQQMVLSDDPRLPRLLGRDFVGVGKVISLTNGGTAVKNGRNHTYNIATIATGEEFRVFSDMTVKQVTFLVRTCPRCESRLFTSGKIVGQHYCSSCDIDVYSVDAVVPLLYPELQKQQQMDRAKRTKGAVT